MSQKYSFQDINEYNVIKVSSSLALSTIYLLKYFILLIALPILLKFPGMDEAGKAVLPYIEQFAKNHINLLLLFSSIPALFVFVAMFKRVPSTLSPFLRKVWQQGRNILLVSVVIDLVLLGIFLLTGFKKLNEVLILIFYLDILVAWYLFKSKRVKDTFAEFPEYKKPVK